MTTFQTFKEYLETTIISEAGKVMRPLTKGAKVYSKVGDKYKLEGTLVDGKADSEGWFEVEDAKGEPSQVKISHEVIDLMGTMKSKGMPPSFYVCQ